MVNPNIPKTTWKRYISTEQTIETLVSLPITGFQFGRVRRFFAIVILTNYSRLKAFNLTALVKLHAEKYVAGGKHCNADNKSYFVTD